MEIKMSDRCCGKKIGVLRGRIDKTEVVGHYCRVCKKKFLKRWVEVDEAVFQEWKNKMEAGPGQ